MNLFQPRLVECFFVDACLCSSEGSLLKYNKLLKSQKSWLNFAHRLPQKFREHWQRFWRMFPWTVNRSRLRIVLPLRSQQLDLLLNPPCCLLKQWRCLVTPEKKNYSKDCTTNCCITFSWSSCTHFWARIKLSRSPISYTTIAACAPR